MITAWAERKINGPIKSRVIGGLSVAAVMGAVSALAVTGAAGPAGASAAQRAAPQGYRGELVSVTPLNGSVGPAEARPVAAASAGFSVPPTAPG
jgi:hypothetical protein